MKEAGLESAIADDGASSTLVGHVPIPHSDDVGATRKVYVKAGPWPRSVSALPWSEREPVIR